MSVEVDFWGLLLVGLVVLAAFGVDLALTYLLRETRRDLRDSRVERDRLRVQLLDLRLELARYKAANPAPTQPLPSTGADSAAVDQAVADIRSHTVVMDAARLAERAAVPPIPTVKEVGQYMPAEKPMHDTAELDRFRPIEVVVHHGRERERSDPPPPIQPEPVVPEVEVLEPVEVPEGDDDPPQDETRVAARGGDDPPTGGRSLTPFGVGRPPSAVGYRYPWRPSGERPTGVLPVVLPQGELPAEWRRRFHRSKPIRIGRVPAAKSVVRELWAGLFACLESWPTDPGMHRRGSDFVGRHRAVTP